MKEMFTTEEWELVKCVPIQAFGVVAGVDSGVDEKESEEFSGRMVRGALGYKDPLHRELAQSLVADDMSKLIQKASETGVGETKAILKSKLSAEQYQSFLGSIFIDSVAVANASGTPGAAVSEAEASMLVAFAMAWDLDLEEVQRIFEEK